MGERRYTALVLAASRGNLDPLAQAGGVSHKCFIDIAGQPMLRRVVEAVMASPRVKRTIVAIEPDSMAEAQADPRVPARRRRDRLCRQPRDDRRQRRRRRPRGAAPAHRHHRRQRAPHRRDGDLLLRRARRRRRGRGPRPHPRFATSSKNIPKGIAPSTVSATAPFRAATSTRSSPPPASTPPAYSIRAASSARSRGG